VEGLCAVRVMGHCAVAEIKVGDRVRVTAGSQTHGFAAGETGTVVRIAHRPGAFDVIMYAVKIDRVAGAGTAYFLPGEVEPAP
jgi:hypothetical protein